MLRPSLVAVLALILCLVVVDVSAQGSQCTRSIGPPGNFCPSCSKQPNYLWARKSGTTSCIRCYEGCLIETLTNDESEAVSLLDEESQSVCEAAQPFRLAEIPVENLVTLDSDPEKIYRLASRYPIAASALSVLDTSVDPMSMLAAEQEFQVNFKNLPMPRSSMDYLNGVEQTGRDAYAKLLPVDQDVLVTAQTKALANGSVAMTINAVLRTADMPSRALEGPVTVTLRPTGAYRRVSTKAHGDIDVTVLGIEEVK